MKRIISLLMVIAMFFVLCSCDNGTQDDVPFYDEYPTGEEIVTIEIERNPEAEIKLTDGSVIKVELYYYSAPNAVANFIAFANEKVYDTMHFSQVRNNCILMTDYIDSEASAPYYVMDEIQPDSEDKLSHVRGTISMIRTSDSDTLTGQFFILTKDQKHFDSRFTSFGKIIEGMDVVDKIVAAQTDDEGNFVSPIGIESVEINTFGADFPTPTIILK